MLGQKLDSIRLDIYEGKGFGLIRGLDPKNHSSEDLTMMYLGIQSYIANRCGQQDEKGNMLGQYCITGLVKRVSNTVI
jgi:hypothetical protein